MQYFGQSRLYQFKNLVPASTSHYLPLCTLKQYQKSVLWAGALSIEMKLYPPLLQITFTCLVKFWFKKCTTGSAMKTPQMKTK